MFSGAMASKPSVTSAIMSSNTPSVRRVRADGAIALTFTWYRASSTDAITVSAAIPAFAAP